MYFRIKKNSYLLIFIMFTSSFLSLSCTQNTIHINKNYVSLPSFTLTTIDNKIITSNEFKDKLIIINFLATSCSTCIAEMPKFVNIYNKYNNRGLIILAIAMPYDVPMYVTNFAKTRSLPFLVGIDYKSEAVNAFADVSLTPTTFIFNRGKFVQ